MIHLCEGNFLPSLPVEVVHLSSEDPFFSPKIAISAFEIDDMSYPLLRNWLIYRNPLHGNMFKPSQPDETDMNGLRQAAVCNFARYNDTPNIGLFMDFVPEEVPQAFLCAWLQWYGIVIPKEKERTIQICKEIIFEKQKKNQDDLNRTNLISTILALDNLRNKIRIKICETCRYMHAPGVTFVRDKTEFKHDRKETLGRNIFMVMALEDINKTTIKEMIIRRLNAIFRGGQAPDYTGIVKYEVKYNGKLVKTHLAKKRFFKSTNSDYVKLAASAVGGSVAETIMRQTSEKLWSMTGLRNDKAVLFSNVMNIIISIYKNDKNTAQDLLTLVIRSFTNGDTKEDLKMDIAWDNVKNLVKRM